MSEIYLLRHGETEWNAACRFQGQQDSPLTPRGREQAGHLGRILSRALGDRPKPPLHASPLGRTLHTASILRHFLPGLAPTVAEPRLREVSAGCWDGLTLDDIEAGWPGALDGTDEHDWYFRSPDGEDLDAASRRVQDWLDHLRGPVVAVSHGLLGRLVRGAWLGMPASEALLLPVPQDVVWHLSAAGVAPLAAP